MRVIQLFFCYFLFVTASCDDPNAPLDADSRRTIDSSYIAQSRILKLQMDSLCSIETAEKLPFLIDSIRQERLKEIEALKRGATNGF